MRRSSSICASPGPPRMPMPPVWRSRWLQRRTSRVAMVLQPRQFDLQLAFVALRAGGEDVEDQRGAVGNRHAQVLLEVALLRRRQSLVEDDAVRLVAASTRALISSALPEPTNSAGIGRLAPAMTLRDWLVACGGGQQRQFVQRGVEGRARAEVDARPAPPERPAPRRSTGDRDRWRKTSRQYAPGRCGQSALGSLGSWAWKLTARPGTTVEMACL